MAKKKPKPDPLTVVAQRFLKIFDDHSIAITQIPRLIPGISLEQLRDHDSLLPALKPEVLQQTADLFKIQRKWLEGTSPYIYDPRYCYKNPWAFFEDVGALKIDHMAFPVVAFTSVDKLKSTSGRKQPLVLVLREPCAELDDKTIYRYIIQDQLDWGYWKCRIQLKAMMRVWYKKYGVPVRIYQIDRNVLEQIENGAIVPRPYYQNSRRLEDADLEDYSLLPSESRQSRDQDEMQEVMDYIEAYKLEDVGKRGIGNPRGSGDTLRFT